MIKPAIILVFFLLSVACGEQITLPPLEKNAVILSFGDSLTYGTGSIPENAYPAILAKRINRTVINAGVPGEITKDGLSRLPALIKQHHPDLIIICHGGNDILRKYKLQNTQDNIQQMIDLAEQYNIPVVLIGVPEFGVFLDASPIYQALAENNKLALENDILSDILSQAALKSDHIHPNARGYQLLAESITKLLMQTGAITDQ